MCECCQKDNSNIFLVRNIVLFSFPFELLDRRLLFCGFRFHVSITHNAGAVLIHGSQYYITLHLILIFPAGMFLCADFVLWTIRIPRRGYCVVFVFSRTLGTCVPVSSSEFRLHRFLSRATVLIGSVGVAESYVRYKYNYDIILWEIGDSNFNFQLINICSVSSEY